MRPNEVTIRPEAPADFAAVHEVLARAFPSDAEAGLVDVLRANTQPQISLVAEGSAAEVLGVLYRVAHQRERDQQDHQQQRDG